MTRGNAEKVLGECDHVIESDVFINGQEHVYLETQTSMVVPKDAENFDVYCSTQCPDGQQREMARILGIQLNKINLKVKRVGMA